MSGLQLRWGEGGGEYPPPTLSTDPQIIDFSIFGFYKSKNAAKSHQKKCVVFVPYKSMVFQPTATVQIPRLLIELISDGGVCRAAPGLARVC